MLKNYCTACTLASLSFVLSGCGGNEFGPMGSIKGKLTLDGQPLAAGTKVIFMQPTQGYSGFGITDEAGDYTIEWRRSGTTYDSMPIGKYEVMLVPAGTVDVDEMSAEEMLAGGPKPAPKSAAIPAKFLRASTSGLAYDVVAGENIINIEARSK